MKTKTKILHKKIIHFILGITCLLYVTAQAQIPINHAYFGQNAWYLINDPSVSAGSFSSGFDLRLADIAASGVKTMRIGGADANFVPLYLFNSSLVVTDIFKLTHLIVELRNNGIEPIIEVGFNPICDPLGVNVYPPNSWTGYTKLGSLTALQQGTLAANVVTAVNTWCSNNSQAPVLNWIIANEPDLTLGSCTAAWPASPGGYGYSSSTSAASIAPYIIDFSTKMKTAFPSPALTIIGPELAKFGNDNGWAVNALMNDLIGGTNSIMGQISGGAADGQYFIDVLSFHYYPNTVNNTIGPPQTRADVIADPTQCKNGFRNNLNSSGSCTGGITQRGLIYMITTNTSRTPADLQIACTEFNLPNTTTDNESTNYTDMILGDFGYRSFIGGQWMAEVLCEGMNANTSGDAWVKFMNPWSTQESGANANLGGLGYISACTSTTQAKRPTYGNYKMVAEHFAPYPYADAYSDFFPNKCTSNLSTYKAYGYTQSSLHNPNYEIGVLIMNQDLQSGTRGSDVSTKQFKINFANGAINTTTGEDMFFDFDMGISISDYHGTITNETTLWLKFDPTTGTLIDSEIYSVGDAMSGTVPLRISNTTNNINTQTDYDNYSPAVYADIVIDNGSNNITASSSDNQVFSFFNSCTINTTSSGSYTIPSGQTLTLKPTPAPH